MKRFLQCLCLILVFVTLFTTTAFAAEANARASDYFMSHSIYLWKTSSNTFDVCFDVVAVGTMEELGASYVEVQRSTDKVNWECMQTYYSSSYSQMIGENTFRHVDCVSYTYTKGYYYRAYVTLYAARNNGSAEYYDYTAVLDLR